MLLILLVRYREAPTGSQASRPTNRKGSLTLADESFRTTPKNYPRPIQHPKIGVCPHFEAHFEAGKWLILLIWTLAFQSCGSELSFESHGILTLSDESVVLPTESPGPIHDGDDEASSTTSTQSLPKPCEGASNLWVP